MTITDRITIYSRMNDAIDKAEADSYRETDDLEQLMHDAFRDHDNHRQAGYDRGFQAEFQAEQDRLSAIYTNATDAYYEARRQAVSRVDAFFVWLSSAELVDAIPAGDQHGPTYDQLLRSAAEDSYEAERRLRFKDGDWTPESYAPHRAALERYYELYKLAPAWQRVIAGSVA